MTTTTVLPNPHLSMLSLLYALFDALGGHESSLGTRGKRLRSYESKRDFFSDVMLGKLLSVFAGNYQFKTEKELTLKKHQDTETVFDYLFNRAESFVFFMQRDADIAYYSGKSFPIASYICASLAVINQGLIHNDGHEYVKTCPFLYLNKSIKDIISNKYNVTQTIKKMVIEYIDKLSGDYSKSKINLYNEIFKLDEKRNTSKKASQIYLDINKLKDDLRLLQSRKISKQQNILIEELWGRYNSLVFLSRLRNILEEELKIAPDDFLESLNDFISIPSITTSLGGDESGYMPISFEQITKEFNYDFDFKEPELILVICRLYNRIFHCLWKNKKEKFHSMFFFEKHYSDFYSGLFISLENLKSAKIDTIKHQLEPLSGSCNLTFSVIQCLNHFQKGQKEEAKSILEELTPNLQFSPYSLKKIICTLYIGILLSSEFQFRNNSLSEYIEIYLSTSLPSLDLYLESDPHFDKALIDKYMKGKYDLNYGLIRMIGEYNRFIIFNDLNIDILLVNPLKNINIFLEQFFINYEKTEYARSVDRSELALDGLKTLLRNAKAPLINFNFIELEKEFILVLLGLDEWTVFEYSDVASIRRFLKLPTDEQQAIREACEKYLPA